MDVNDLNGAHLPSKSFLSGANQIEVLCEEVESAITVTFVGCRFLKRLCDVQTSHFSPSPPFPIFISSLTSRLQMCRKLSTVQLTERLDYSTLPGLNPNMKNGSLKEGTLNWEMLQFKPKFPRQVLLCRVGEFYEAWGINVCILVEYEVLNPFGGLQSDSIPRAGCPVVNLRQTLDDRTQSGYSVAQGPTQARSRKRLFISGEEKKLVFFANVCFILPAILPVYEYMLLINFGLNTALWRRQAQGPTQARSRKRLFISGCSLNVSGSSKARMLIFECDYLPISRLNGLADLPTSNFASSSFSSTLN
ncbi:DNA mismatch repair protein MSH1, mitochondrial [Glycine soja]